MAVMDKYTGKLLNYRQLMNSQKYKKAWSLSAANKFGRLVNGIGGRIKNPTNTIEFISQHQVPEDCRKEVTYGQFVCLVRPEKAEPNQMQFTVGGDRIDYPREVATPTAEMLVAKMLFNSVISTKGARFMTMDIFNFYLMTPLHRPEFIWIKLTDIPNKVIKEYMLREIASKNVSIYIRAKRGMYGDYWPTNSSKNASKRTDADKVNWYLAFGSMTKDPYSSYWWWMTSASNTLAKNIHNISRMHLKNTTNLRAIGQENGTSG
jgi:hypothetical protein